MIVFFVSLVLLIDFFLPLSAPPTPPTPSPALQHLLKQHKGKAASYLMLY